MKDKNFNLENVRVDIETKDMETERKRLSRYAYQLKELASKKKEE